VGVSLHRVNSIDFEIQPTFNVNDTEIIDLIEDEFGKWYCQAGYKLSVDDLNLLILKLKDSDPMAAASFKRDKLWAELHRTKWVLYTVIGDNEWNGN